jgi:hypothetical protein
VLWVLHVSARELQAELEFAGEVEAAFMAGRVRLVIDKPRPMTSREIGFAGDGLKTLRSLNHTLTIVHVMSKPAGGEIRGYVIVDNEKTLRVRTPNYTGRWPDLDAAVMARTKTTSVLYPEAQ